MADPTFGVTIRKIDNEPRPAIAADLSTIGVIGPAPDADPDIFPLDEPVLLHSNNVSMLSKIGETGYIADAIRGIQDQLAETEFAARVVFVRTALGTNVDTALKLQETITKIVGSSTLGTGINAFLKSAQKTGVTPRVILAPGYTGPMANTIDTVTRTIAGSGYAEGVSYPLTFTNGGTGAIQATGHAIGQSDGKLGPPVIDSLGAWYTSAPTITAPASPGQGGTLATYTATVSQGANPICASLTGVLNKLLGVAAVESSGTSYQNDIDWRETFQSERLIPLSGGVKVLDPVSGSILVRPLAPRFAGMLVGVDHEKGAPFHSAANRPIQGIVAPSRDITFALTDDANEAQDLLKANIGVVVRGEMGDDFAIASAGFVLIATDTAAEDPLWQMYNVRRGRDFIHLTLLRALRFYLGRYNINGHTIQALLNTMKGVLRDLKADDHILGYRVGFKTEGNSPEQIRLGRLTIGFAAEEPPVLKHLTVESARYREAIDAMVADLASQLNLSA